MSAEDLWNLTPREFWYLWRVWKDDIEREEHRHAEMMALLLNAHFVNEDIPWTAEDLMGHGNREKRKAQALHDKVETQRRMAQSYVQAQKDKLAAQRGEKPEGLPAWVPLNNPSARPPKKHTRKQSPFREAADNGHK